MSNDLGDLTADLDYPMVVVTAVDGEDREGCLVGFSSQCSISPLRVMIWISKVNRTSDVATQAEALAVHYLSTKRTASWPSSSAAPPATRSTSSSGARGHRGPSGAAILDDCARWFVGRVLERLDSGDHTGLLLEPVASQVEPWEGQLGYQLIRDLDPGHPA